MVENSEYGTLFFPDDFAALGSSDAIRAALVRLCRSGVLMRAAQGIYYYPKVDTKWGSGIIPPTIEEIAEGIAKRDKVCVQYVRRILNLSFLSPKIVRAILNGTQPADCILKKLLSIKSSNWQEQEQIFYK